MKNRNDATSGDFQKVKATQNNLAFSLSSPQKVVKKSTSKKIKNSNQSSNLTTTNELEKNSLLNNSTQTPTDTSVTATNADDYTRNTAGGNASPTPTSADFAENIEFNKTLLIEFVEVLLKATPPEHKNAVEYALTALRYTNKYKLTIPCLLDAFVCGLVKLNVPKNIIKLTTPILCEVLPDTTPELVERKLNEENNGFELEFFSQYLAENYDNFAGKFVDNSWLAELNKANWLKFEPCEVSEMPPAAETKISQATGTDGDLPTQIQPTKITIAEADSTATAKQNYLLKGDAQNFAKERNMSTENFTTNSNLTTNNNNAENDTATTTTSDVNSQNITDFITEATGHPLTLPKEPERLGAYENDYNNVSKNKNLIKYVVFISEPKSKAPRMQGWQKHLTTESELDKYKKSKDNNFGIRCGYLNFLDFDVKNNNDFVKNVLKEIKNFFVKNKISNENDILQVRGRFGSSSCALPFICENIHDKFNYSKIITPIIENGKNAEIECFIQDTKQVICCGTQEKGRYVWNTEDGYFPTEFPTLTIQQYGDLLKLLTEKFSANTPDLLNKKHKKQIKNNNNKQVITNNVSNDVIVNNNNSATDDYVAESNFVLDYLQKNNLITGRSNDGGYILECPFSHLHSTNNEKDFCFYPANTNNYKTFNFKCFHSHCSNKSKYDFVKALSSDLYNTIKKYEVKNFEDANGNVFLCSNDGLLVIENTGKTDENGDIITNKIKLLNKPFFVAGEFFDKVNQNNHGYIIEFKNIAGTLQRMPVKSAELATDAVKTFNFLFANGLKKITTKINLKNLCEKYLLSYLNCFNFEKNLFNYTNKSGWQGDCCDVYIRPAIADAGEIYFGENENNKYFYENTNNQITFTAKGNLAEWKENVGKYIKGNPLLIVALLQCLTGFFLKELKFNDCIYFNVVGLSSSGKSVLLNVCRSLISGNNLNLSWGGSISGAENVLKQFNHCFIPIDELTKISESDLKHILKVIYSNTGRMLSTRSGNSNREIKRWLLTGISTSEKTFKEIAQQYKYNTMDGQEVRFIDIEFANLNYKYGVFKTVAEPTDNNTTDGQIFAEMLRDNSNTFYGTPMIELLKYLTAPSNENNNVKNITKIHSYLSFVKKNLNLCKNYFPATLNRIASYFNNLIAVGSMLSKDGDFGLLPVEKCDILNAVLEVFNLVENKFKNDDGGYTTCTGANIYQNLTSFILQNENRFRPRLKPEIGDFFEPDKCAGYYDLVGSNTQGKNKIYYIFTDIFENEIAKDIPKKTALRELEKLGYIQKGRLCYKTEIRFYDRTSGSSENRITLYKFENLFK